MGELKGPFNQTSHSLLGEKDARLVRDLEKESNQCGDIGKVDCLQLLQGTKLLKEVLLEDGVVLGTFQEVIEASPIVSEIF